MLSRRLCLSFETWNCSEKSLNSPLPPSSIHRICINLLGSHAISCYRDQNQRRGSEGVADKLRQMVL